jgi:dihydroxy-acid dehydratase
MSLRAPLARSLRSRALHTSAVRAAGARPPPGALNRLSRTITAPKDQGASQAMLYATPGIENDEDLTRAMVGVASVW